MGWRLYLALARVAGAGRRLSPTVPAVALTFDDGPHPESTPAVLDALAAHGAVATFFCVGRRVQEHPELVHRMVAEGHSVGSHSQTHRVGGLPAAEVLADYADGRAALEQVLGRPAPLFRPPHGWLDARTAWGLRRAGLRSWLWTVDPRDYQPGTGSADISRVVGSCEAGDVVLMHDALEEAEEGAPARSVVVEALPDVIGALRGRGLTLVTLS